MGISLILHLILVLCIAYRQANSPGGEFARRPAGLSVRLLHSNGTDQIGKAGTSGSGAASTNRVRNDADTKGDMPALLDISSAVLHYYSIAELDVAPEVLADIPANSIEIANFPQGGRMRVELLINEEGKLDGFQILASNLSEALTESLRSNFMQQTLFLAGRKNGNNVRSRIRIEINVDDLQSPSNTAPNR